MERLLLIEIQMKKFAYILFLVALFGCDSGNQSPVVNVFTSRHYDTDRALYQAFEKETGIKVAVKEGKDDELIRTIEEAGEKTQADVLITADAARLYRAKSKGLFAPLQSAVIQAAIPEKFRDSHWTALTYRARVIAYDTTKTDPAGLNSYQALATGRYKVLVRPSDNIYNQSLMAALISRLGMQAAENWAKGVVASMARPPQGNDTDQIKALAAGEGEVALVNSYYFFKLLANSSPEDLKRYTHIRLAFPSPTHINISGVGIVKHAKNKDNALKFIEFLVRKDIQEQFAAGNFEYPANPLAAIPAALLQYSQFEADTVAFSTLGRLNTEASRVFDRAGWK